MRARHANEPLRSAELKRRCAVDRIGNLTALAPHQPIFFAATTGFLGIGYYLVYRQPGAACADRTCAQPVPGRIVKGVLWAATGLTLAAVVFDCLGPAQFGT